MNEKVGEIKAQIVERDGKILMVKDCEKHGHFEDVMSIDTKFSQHLEEVFPGRDIRAHNDYCADICNPAPERLIAFSVLNPAPQLAKGSLKAAVDMMIVEARRCYHELGMRGVKMVPAGWYPNDPEVVRLYHEIADLGMYVVFHSGIFLDGREGTFCRPAYYEGVHHEPRLRAQLAHLSWPWVDECIAVLGMETIFAGSDPKKWQLKADLSFGPPDDWQLEAWQKAIDSLPHEMRVCREGAG